MAEFNFQQKMPGNKSLEKKSVDELSLLSLFICRIKWLQDSLQATTEVRKSYLR